EPQGKPDQVCRNHHEHITDRADAAEHAVLRRTALPLPLGEQRRGYPLWRHEEDNQPSPDKQTHLDVVPEGDKSEDEEVRQYGPGGLTPSAERRTPERHVNIPDEPAVVRAVPGAPEE